MRQSSGLLEARDYLSSSAVRIALIATLSVGSGLGQDADEYGAYFPPSKPAEAAAKEADKLLHLIKAGSGPDRAKFRQEFMQLGPDGVPELIGRLESGNQFFSWNAALILGELRDPRALDPLNRVVSEQSRGDPLAASLALGRYEDPAALDALVVQVLSGRSREARRAATLAIGRIRAPKSVAKLTEVSREAKQQIDQATALVGLGMTADLPAIPEIAAKLKATDDRVRRAAAVALGLLPASEETEALAPRATRRRRSGGPDLGARNPGKGREPRHRIGAPGERVPHPPFRRAGPGGGGARRRGARRSRLGCVPRQAAGDPSELVRAAAIGGLAAAPKPHGDALVVKGLQDSQHGKVRLASVIALAVLAGRRGASSLDLTPFLEDRDADVRDAALVAHAWLNGPAAKPALARVIAGRKEGPARRRASVIDHTLDVSADLAHRLLRAELQVLLDDAGVAPSWNVHRLANEQIIVLLGLENAIPEMGGGRGGDFSQAAAVRRVPPRLEDVRRHLDIFPYSDQRSSLEFRFWGGGGRGEGGIRVRGRKEMELQRATTTVRLDSVRRCDARFGRICASFRLARLWRRVWRVGG